jgi:hypothetical protein
MSSLKCIFLFLLPPAAGDFSMLEEMKGNLQIQQAIIQNQQKQIDELKALVNKITANTVVK